MGYLTTLTVYNDGIDLLPDNAEKFAKGVLDASREAGMRNEPITLGISMFCNLVTVQVPRHADHHTVYVNMGNSVFEMNAYDQQTKEMLENNPKFFERAVDFLEDQVKELKKMIKESKNQKENTPC